MDFTQNIDQLWLLAGAVLIILEFIVFPGVGFLFAGLAAITTGILLTFGIVPDTVWQWAIFFGFTVAWAALLWKPFKNFRTGKNQKQYSDMIGHKALITEAIAPGKLGKARWSGTIMNAKAEDPAVTITEGAEVIIAAAEGNTLIVK